MTIPGRIRHTYIPDQNRTSIYKRLTETGGSLEIKRLEIRVVNVLGSQWDEQLILQEEKKKTIATATYTRERGYVYSTETASASRREVGKQPFFEPGKTWKSVDTVHVYWRNIWIGCRKEETEGSVSVEDIQLPNDPEAKTAIVLQRTVRNPSGIFRRQQKTTTWFVPGIGMVRFESVRSSSICGRRTKEYPAVTYHFVSAQVEKPNNTSPLCKTECKPWWKSVSFRLPWKNGELWGALRDNNCNDIVKALNQRANPNSRDKESGETPLERAISRRDTELISLLFQHGARVKPGMGIDLLKKAIDSNRVEVLKALLDQGLDLNERGDGGMVLLDYAREKRALHLIPVLLSRGADVNAWNKLGNTLLALAVKNGDRDLVALLLQHRHRADVNARNATGRTPLWEAVDAEDVNLMELLLFHGANPNPVDDHKQSLLTFTVGSKSPCAARFIKVLIEGGAVVNEREDRGVRLLKSAINKSDEGAIRLLLAHGADPNGDDNTGNSVLRYTLDQKSEAQATILVKLLIEEGGAVVTREEDRGAVLLKRAIRNQPNLEAVKLLLSHGADPNGNDGTGVSVLKYARGIAKSNPLRIGYDSEMTDILAYLRVYGARE